MSRTALRVAASLAALAGACGGPGERTPPVTRGAPRAPGANPGIVEALRADVAAPRHVSDGGGRAWLVPDPEGRDAVRVGQAGRFEIRYAAGPHGIAVGGMLLLQVSPFWGWSTPQTSDPEAPGFTRVDTTASGVTLDAQTLEQQLLGIRIGGRPLSEGEVVAIVYGAGAAGAVADRYAERGSVFWIGVDGDADGVRALLPESPRVDVAPGPPARIVALLPSTARPGDGVRLTLAVLDAVGNAGVDFTGEVRLGVPEGLELPSRVRLAAADRGRTTLDGRALSPGTFRVQAETPNGLRAESNPLLVAAHAPRLLWADLHGHSQLSDGTGSPEDYFAYARDVAALDVVSLTDHDHWGMRPLSQAPDQWQRIRAAVLAANEPGRFVTLLGYEWTSWIHGHRHVLYFGDEGAVHSSVDPAFEHPRQLWDALRGQAAITIAHHSAGGPIGTNWTIPPDPELEPVTEIVSVHGSSEAPDSPGVIYSAVPGNFVRDALDRGYVLGFLGSGDSHDGHPGLAHLASPSSGLAGVFSEGLDRASVLAALRARRVYATNGPRIVLRARLGVAPMGAALSAAGLHDAATLEMLAVAPAPIARADVIRSGRVVHTEAGAGTRFLERRWSLDGLRAGEYVYVRVVQEDGGAAWSSPVFVSE